MVYPEQVQPDGFLRKLLLSFLALSFLGFAHAEDPAQQVIGPFGTLNNRDNSAAIADNMAQDLLNVDITPGGKSFKKRKGYGPAFATTITTSAIHGTYDFYTAAGNDVTLAFNDTYLTSSISGASPTVLFSTGPLAATYQCIDSQGFAYCANTSRTNIIKTDGSTYSSLTVVSTGTMVAVTPDRLVLAGFSGAPNRIDFSAGADFTSWTTGVAATSAFQFTITAPGAGIKHITYAFNRIMWFKDSSFGYILPGTTAADWVVKTISPVVGTLDNTSVYWQDVLYFRGQDGHIYSYDGSSLQKISKEISGTISQSQTRTQNSWTQTTQSDFQAGASVPSTYISTAVMPGSLVLDTATAVSSFIDTVSTDFGAAASVTNLDTTTVSGSILLVRTSSQTFNSQLVVISSEIIGNHSNPTFGGCNNSPGQYQKFLATQNYRASQVSLILKRDTAYTGGVTVTLGAGSVTIANGSIPTSQTTIVSTLSASVDLLAGTTYTLTVTATGDSYTTGGVYWFYDTSGSPYSLGATNNTYAHHICGACACGVDYDDYDSSELLTRSYAYAIKGSSYAGTGSLVSRTFDVGFTTNTWIWNWSTLTARGTTPTGASVTYETQTSSDSVGGFDSLITVANGSSPTSTVKRFIRYKTSFTTTDASTSPVINDISIAMTSRIRPGATYYSAVKNASNLRAWDSFQATYQNSGGSQTFSIRSSTNSFSVLSSTPAWTAVSPGGIPSISTGTYFQVADQFLVTNATQNPTLNDFTQTWFEGTASDKAYATYFNDSILWSVTYGASTSNNRILKYDLLNQGWLIYDIASNGFYLRNLSMYFGSASAGYVYKYGDTDNDNGSAINAYWKSKDFIGGDPFRNEEIRSLSIYGAALQSTVTVTMTTNEVAVSSYTVPTYRSGSYFFDSNRSLATGIVSNSFNVKVGNNAVDQPFEIIAERVGLAPKPWNPTSQ